MFAEQRRLAILDRLESRGSVRVVTLAHEFAVAVETIRRDLEYLERDGKLTRTHGGAVPRIGGQDIPFAERRSANHDAKVAIARHAVGLIGPNDVVAFDASSTVYELVRMVPDIPLSVVTNSMPVLSRLCSHSQVRIFSTGGTMDIPSRSMVGPFAEDVLAKLNVGKLFLSSKGVHLSRGLSELDEEHARIKRQLMEIAEEVYLLVDHSKLGRRAAVYVADIEGVTQVITDKDADGAFLGALHELGVQTEVVG